jgi:precorrin-6B methylase 1
LSERDHPGPAGLRDFLAQLSIDPDRLSGFIRDPGAAMDAAALDEGGRRAIVSGSAAVIWNALVGDGPAASANGSAPVEPPARPAGGSLIVVGTGIRTVGQLTLEAIAWMREADVVLYLIADPVAEEAIRLLNPAGAMSLRGYYGEGLRRSESYEAMVQHITGCVRAGMTTCVAFYGHPGVFAYPSHESIRRLRAEGYPARMLPAVSAEDCLFADLGVDPAVNGCQSLEASDFLLHQRLIDTTSQLILWQVGVVGDWTYRRAGYDLSALPLLVERLCALYGAFHEGFIYEAAVLPGLAPNITRVAMGSISADILTAASTLYVPPVHGTVLNRPVAEALGIGR